MINVAIDSNIKGFTIDTKVGDRFTWFIL